MPRMLPTHRAWMTGSPGHTVVADRLSRANARWQSSAIARRLSGTRIPKACLAGCCAVFTITHLAADPAGAPAWQGTVLTDCETLGGWAVESAPGSSGSLALAAGLFGNGVALDWGIGSGDWVQARYDFASPTDLSRADILGLSWHGDSSSPPNTLAVMFADVQGVFQGYEIPGTNHGVNQIDRWVINHPIPKKAFYHFWGPAGQTIDWSRINRCFVVVKKPGGGGSGRLTIDHLQSGRAADWPRQQTYDSINTTVATTDAAATAMGFLLSQQRATGLFVSWTEELPQNAWLYDQALVLIALSREGRWSQGAAGNNAAQAAEDLASFLVTHQKPDGHWARRWNPDDGTELADDGWVGDQAWCIMALEEFSFRSGLTTASVTAKRGAQWLAERIEPAGSICGFPSTEGTVDVWWAMISTLRFADAQRIKGYLLGENGVWDPDLRYWWRGGNDPLVAIDAATWTSAFARHPLVEQPERGKAALSFVRRTLATTSDNGLLCGFDGQGPTSVWNEGTAQYVAAGGEDSRFFLDMLISRQNPDGSMPGSPDSWTTDAFGWLTQWKGISATAWLYFAITGSPFPEGSRDRDGDQVPDWSEGVAGTDAEDGKSFPKIEIDRYDHLARTVTLSWESSLGRLYTLWRATNPATEWAPVAGAADRPGTDQRMEFVADTSASAAAFFRVSVRLAEP